MKIKYLKDAPLGKAGDTADIPTMQANVLIKLGIAEPHQTTRRSTKKKTDDDSEK